MSASADFCPRAAELPDLVRGALSAERAQDLTSHAAHCEDCREDLALLRRLQQRWDSDRASGSGLEARLRAGIPQGAFLAPPQPGRVGLLAGLSVAAVIVTLLVLLNPFLSVPPRDDTVAVRAFREDALRMILGSRNAQGALCGSGEAAQRYAVGITGLSMQALLQYPERTDCRDALQQASEFLLRGQAPDGLFGPPVNDALYNHAPALLALMRCAEADPRLRIAVQRGLSALLVRQKADGGFGYGDALTGNSVISVWPLEVLSFASARGQGAVAGPLARLGAFFDRCRAHPDSAVLTYAPGGVGPGTPALAALGSWERRLRGLPDPAPVTPPGTEAYSLSFQARCGSADAPGHMLQCTQSGAGSHFQGAYSSVALDAVAAAALSLIGTSSRPPE